MVTLKKITIAFAVAWVSAILAGCASTQAAHHSNSHQANSHWVGVWGASPVVSAPNTPGFNNRTLRLIAHPSLSGESIRVRIGNTFGAQPLSIGAATVALQADGASIIADSMKVLTFGGRSSISVPPGALVVSDPVALRVSSKQNVAVSLFFPTDTGPASAHPGANQTSFVSGAGNFSTASDAASFATTIPSWPFLTNLEVQAAENVHAVVTFGDSITDGYKSTVNANRRWPDYLAARLNAANRRIAVVNEGISGNRVLHDSLAAQPRFGANALARFDRDVLAVSGATCVVVLIGINDIGMGSLTRNPNEAVSAEDIIGGLQQMAVRAHARGLKVIGATLTPFRPAAYFSEEGEKKREAVNTWVRSSKELDGVIDFDKATRDPSNPSQFLAAYDSGDHLHPNDAGYKAMADSIDLSLFK